MALHQSGFSLLLIADVAQEAGEPGRLAADAGDRELDRDLAAVRAHRHDLGAAPEDLALAGLGRALYPCPMGFSRGGRHDQLCELFPYRLGPGVSERALGRRV